MLATPFSLCSNVAPRSHPGARRLTPPFRLRRNRACGHRPHRGRCVGLPRFRFAQAWPLGQQPGACRHSAPFRCAKPRVRLPAPPFGFAAQNQARHFAARNHPVRLSASRPWLRHPAPVFCRPRHGSAAPGPQRQKPGPCSRSVAFRLRRNRAGRSLPPPGATCSLPHFRFAQMWPRARTPALVGLRLRFACGETARAVIGPTFWVCRAKSGAAFRCAKPPCAVVRFAAMASPPRTSILPSPSRLRRAGSPTAKTRPLLPFGRISLRETGLAGRCPRRGQRARYPIFALLKCGPALAPRRSSAYASVSPAAKPRVRSSAPPFGFAAQNQARHFAARNHPVRLSASRA